MNVHDIHAKQNAAVLAGLRAAGSTIEPPSSLDPTAMAVRAVRTVRRRRTVRMVAAGLAGAVVAVAGGFALTYDAASDRAVLPGSVEVSAGPSPVTSVEPTPEQTGPRPAKLPGGWQAAEFRGLSYALPGSWVAIPFDEDTTEWSGPEQSVEMEGAGSEDMTSTIADSLFMRADMHEPPGWDRKGETRREELEVPGAESATLTAGTDPDSQDDWADLLIHHEDGLWYSAHFEFVTDAARPGQVAEGFAESLAFRMSAEEVREGIEGLQGSGDLPVLEVDRETPSDWMVREFQGMRYAVPGGMSADPLWQDEDPSGAEGWLVPDGVQEGVDIVVTAIREYDGYGATLPPPEDAQTFEIEGAGRVEVTVREAEPWHNGATPLDVQFRVWDEELSAVWDITATLPNTPEGEETAMRILGSVRLL
jgi:hypothetical protein